MIFFLLIFYLTQSVCLGTPIGSPDVLVEQIALDPSILPNLPSTDAGKYLAIDPYGQALYYVSTITGSSVTVTKTGNPTSTPIGSGPVISAINGPTDSTFAGLTISSDGRTLYTGWKKTSSMFSIQSSTLSTGAILPTFSDINTSDSLVSLLAVDNTAYSSSITSVLYVVLSQGIYAYNISNTSPSLLWHATGLTGISTASVGGNNLFLAFKNGVTSPFAGSIARLTNLSQYTSSAPTSSNFLTIAGSTSSGFVNGNGTSAKFTNIQGLAFQGQYLYVADTGNNAIRRVDLKATHNSVNTYPVTTIAGVQPPPVDRRASPITSGTGSQAYFNNPMNCVVDSGGEILYFMAGGGTYKQYDGSSEGTDSPPTPLTLQRLWLPIYVPDDSNTNNAALRQAIRDKNAHEVTNLLSFSRAGTLAFPADFDSNGWTALHVLASVYQECYKAKLQNPQSWKWYNWLSMWNSIKTYIGSGPIYPQVRLMYFLHPNQWGDTALHTAASYGAWEMISWVIDLCKTDTSGSLVTLLQGIPGAYGNTMLHTIMANNNFDKSSDGSWTLGFARTYYEKFYGTTGKVPGNPSPYAVFPDLFALRNNAGWYPLLVAMKDRGQKHAKLYYDALVLEEKYTLTRAGDVGTRSDDFGNSLNSPYSGRLGGLPFQSYDDQGSHGGTATNASLIGYLHNHGYPRLQ